MTISIRKATIADYRALCTVLDEGDLYHRQALPHVFRAPDGPARSPAYIASVISSPNACFFVAEQGERIVGAVHVLLRETRDIPILVPRRFAVIENLIVLGSSRIQIKRLRSVFVDRGSDVTKRCATCDVVFKDQHPIERNNR